MKALYDRIKKNAGAAGVRPIVTGKGDGELIRLREDKGCLHDVAQAAEAKHFSKSADGRTFKKELLKLIAKDEEGKQRPVCVECGGRLVAYDYSRDANDVPSVWACRYSDCDQYEVKMPWPRPHDPDIKIEPHAHYARQIIIDDPGKNLSPFHEQVLFGILQAEKIYPQKDAKVEEKAKEKSKRQCKACYRSFLGLRSPYCNESCRANDKARQSNEERPRCRKCDNFLYRPKWKDDENPYRKCITPNCKLHDLQIPICSNCYKVAPRKFEGTGLRWFCDDKCHDQYQAQL